MTALIGDQIHFHFDATLTGLPHAKAGTLKALGVSSKVRSPQAPQIPTMAEAGVAGYDAAIWFGVFAPAGTSPVIIEKILTGVQQTLQQLDVVKMLESSGFVIVGNSPKELAQEMAAESRTWVEVVKKTGLKAQ